MILGSGHALAYPISVTIGALAVCVALAPFGTADQIAGLTAVALVIVVYSAYRFAVAFGVLPVRGIVARFVRVSRVRQQYRLTSRSWLEITEERRIRWLPVYFDPRLRTLTATQAELTARTITIDGLRLYPSGPLRGAEPPGRLIDNPSIPESGDRLITATRLRRRLLLDAQPTVTAPFAALLWVYIDGGGLPGYLGALITSAAAALWLSAIRGSDPS